MKISMSHSVDQYFAPHVFCLMQFVCSFFLFFVMGDMMIVAPVGCIGSLSFENYNVGYHGTIQTKLRDRPDITPNRNNFRYNNAFYSAPVLNTSVFASTDGVEVVLPTPGSDITLCTSIPPSSLYKDKMLLVMFTGCSFQFGSVVSSGILGVILYGCPPTPPTNCDPGIIVGVVTGGSTKTGGDVDVSFPVIYISSGDGALLSSYLALNNATVKTSVILRGTGPIHPSEKLGLIAIAQANTIPSSVYASPFSIEWNDPLLLDPNYDPCTSSTPLTTVWCEDGHVHVLFVILRSLVDPLALFGHIDQLPHLNLISVAVNKLTGPIPAAFCALKELVVFDGLDNFFSSLPDCIGSMTSLAYLRMNGCSLKYLPDSIMNIAHQIVQLWLPGNLISSFPDLSKFTSLIDIDISGNNGNGIIPSFKGLPLLNINLAANRLTGSIGADFFDDLPLLLKVDISGNMIQGVVPNFQNSTAVWAINIASNMLSGPIPQSWSNLNQLTVLYASHNRISACSGLAGCSALQSVDLSSNLISNYGSDVRSVPYEISLNNRKLTSILLDHNNLTGPFSFANGFMYPITWLQTLSLSHNQITSLPPEMFDTHIWPSWGYFDVSYNALSGPFPVGTPTSSLTYFNLIGNPLFSVNSLPLWMTVDLSTYVTGSNQEYSCHAVIGASPTLTVHTDPAFNNYQGCLCANGYYGFAPNCTLIPSALTVHGADNISDSAFHDNRFLSGMDTTWTLTPDYPPSSSSSSSSSSPSSSSFSLSSSSSSVRVIILSISLLPSFNSSSNTLTISLGGDGASALLSSSQDFDQLAAAASLVVAQITSNSTSAVPSQVVAVLDNAVTINFKSRDTNPVPHFQIQSRFSQECPDGYVLSVRAMRCQPVYVIRVEFQIIVYVLSALVSCFIAFVIFVIMRHRSSLIVASASVPFCLIILFFLLMMSVGSIFYALQPSTSGSVCHLRAWFTGSSVIGVLAALLTKTNRIRRIFNFKQVADSRISNKDLALTVFLMIFFEMILLACFSSFSSLSSSFQTMLNGQVAMVCPSASDNQPAFVWIAVQFAYVAIFLFGGLIIAFKVRKVPSAFNESSHIAHCLEALLTFGFVIVLVQYITDNSPESLIVLRGLGQAFISLILTLAIFGPKLYFIMDGRQNDKSMIYTKSMLGTNQSMLAQPNSNSSPERAVLNKSSRSSEPVAHGSSASPPSSSSSSSSSSHVLRQGDSVVWRRLDEVEKHYLSMKNALKQYANRCDARIHGSIEFQELTKSLGNPEWLSQSRISSSPSSSSSAFVAANDKPVPDALSSLDREIDLALRPLSRPRTDFPGGTVTSGIGDRHDIDQPELSVRHIKFESISRQNIENL